MLHMIKRDRKNDLDLNQRIKKDAAQLSEKQFYIYDFYAYLFFYFPFADIFIL